MILLNNQLIDQKEINIGIEDRGYQFGDGVYEVVRIYNGKPFRFKDHLIRFERSAKEIKISLQMSISKIEVKILELIKINGLDNGIVYFQVTRGKAPRDHSFPKDTTSILTAYTTEKKRPLEKIENGIKVVSVEDIRWLKCDVKSINLLGNVLAKQHAVENNAGEAIQIRNNIVTEGSSSNFYIIKDKKIYTHPANNLILRGITRNVVEEIATKLEIPFLEKKISLVDVYQAEEAFITSTTSEITPVLQVDDHVISSNPRSITKAIQSEYFKLIDPDLIRVPLL